MPNVHFVTYASGTYKANIKWNKRFVDFFVKPDNSIWLTDEDLRRDEIYTKNRNIFDAQKGAGYWAWKPWSILKAFSIAKEGDIVLYQDCGKGLKYKNFLLPRDLIQYSVDYGCMPGVLVPIHGTNDQWTHNECFENMNCCEERYKKSPQVEAAVSAWSVTDKNRLFLTEWLHYCLTEEAIFDSKLSQISTFRQHRYDQSILTNLVIKYELKAIQLSFQDMHFSKCLSLVSLDLNKHSVYMKLVKKALLFILRMKRKI